jgi:hypothetical protein
MAAPKPSPLWRPTSAQRAGRRGGRRVAVLALTGGILALVGAVAAWLTFPSAFRQPHFVPLCVGEYGDEFPLRRWARQDAEVLRRLPWHQSNTFARQERSLLDGDLRNLAGQGRDQPVVVYISAYVLPGPGGDLFLLPADARLAQSATWIPLREVFAHLRACPARRKLLLLDVMQAFIDPAKGLLANDAAARLEPLLDEMLPQDANLAVLCACSPGQVSLTSEDLGQSVFGHFLYRGLCGEADGAGPTGKVDRRVSVRELAEYVTAEVDRWAQRQRQARQTPQLLNLGHDFALAQVEGECAAVAGLGGYPVWLRRGWEERDRWWADETFRTAPRAFRALETALLRAEQQWRGGAGAEAVRADLQTRLGQVRRRRDEEAPAREQAEPRSLAEALLRKGLALDPPDRDPVVEAQRLAALAVRTRGPKPAEADVKRLEAGTKELLKPFTGKPLQLARVVLAAATEAPLGADAVQFLAGLLGKGRVPALAETDYLKRVATLPPDRRGAWPAEAVLLALQTAREAARAEAADPQALLWVRAGLDRAARRRREGETLLFAADGDRSRAAATLKEARNAYAAINRDLEVIREALRCRDEALVLLPGYAPALEVDPGPARTWEEAVATARSLRALLSEPRDAVGAGPDGPVPKMAELTDTLRHDPNGLKRLRRPLEPEHRQGLIERRKQGDPTDEKVVRALLETTWPKARERVQLFSALRELSAALAARPGPQEALPAWRAGPAVAAERGRALQRARWSLDLLRLEGVEGLGALEKALAGAGRAPQDERRRQALTEELRRAWARASAGATGE